MDHTFLTDLSIVYVPLTIVGGTVIVAVTNWAKTQKAVTQNTYLSSIVDLVNVTADAVVRSLREVPQNQPETFNAIKNDVISSAVDSLLSKYGVTVKKAGLDKLSLSDMLEKKVISNGCGSLIDDSEVKKKYGIDLKDRYAAFVPSFSTHPSSSLEGITPLVGTVSAGPQIKEPWTKEELEDLRKALAEALPTLPLTDCSNAPATTKWVHDLLDSKKEGISTESKASSASLYEIPVKAQDSSEEPVNIAGSIMLKKNSRGNTSTVQAMDPVAYTSVGTYATGVNLTTPSSYSPSVSHSSHSVHVDTSSHCHVDSGSFSGGCDTGGI